MSKKNNSFRKQRQVPLMMGGKRSYFSTFSQIINALITITKIYWIFITLFILTLITILSLWPLEQLPPVPGNDKTHHFIAYGVLMLPMALKKPNYWSMGGLVVLFICWSGAIELLQPYVNRYGEWQDLTANIMGLVFGLLLGTLVRLFFPVNSESR